MFHPLSTGKQEVILRVLREEKEEGGPGTSKVCFSEATGEGVRRSTYQDYLSIDGKNQGVYCSVAIGK